MKIRETFSFAHPIDQITAIEKYCTSLYGSNLWKLDSDEVNMLFSAWKTGIKLAWDVHQGCRTYLLQTVLAPDITSLKVNLLTQFHGFFRGLLDCPSHEVRVVTLLAARDIRSNLGSNMALLQNQTGLNPWVIGRSNLKQELKKAERVMIPDSDIWRVDYLQRLLNERLVAHYKCNQEEEKKLINLINSLVIN